MTARDTFKSKILKKKSWTGMEVGKALILDMAKSFENLKQGRNTSLLTETEKKMLVNGYKNTPQDHRDYNALKEIHDFLLAFPSLYELTQTDMKVQALVLDHAAVQTMFTEYDQHFMNVQMPRIVSQARYNKMVQEQHDNVLAERITFKTLVLETIEYFWKQYKQGKRTPLNKAFKAAEGRPVTNEGILAEGPMNNIDRPEDAPFTGADVLGYADSFYSIWYENDVDHFPELAVDYPEVYDAALKYICSFKELEFVAKTPKKQQISKTLFTRETLYGLNYCGSREKADNFDPTMRDGDGDYFNGGIAVYMPSGAPWRKEPIDENGDFIQPTGPLWDSFRAENLLTPTAQKNLPTRIARIKNSMINLYTRHGLLDRTEQLLDLQGLKVFVSPIEDAENVIKALNQNFAALQRGICITCPDREKPFEIKEELGKLLPPIDLDELKKTADEYMNQLHLSIYSYRADIYDWTMLMYGKDFKGGRWA